MAKKDEFNLFNDASLDNSINKEDFKFVQSDSKSHEQKFQTKPTTFLKDSLKRFAKNKSSVVAACVLGILTLLAIIVPIVSSLDETGIRSTSESHLYLEYLEPKLFPAGTGFWDGTKRLENIPIDISNDPQGNDKEANWWPPEDDYVRTAISNREFKEQQYTNTATNLGSGGYVQFGYYSTIKDTYDYVHMTSNTLEDFDISDDIYFVDNFVVYDKSALEASSETNKNFPTNYEEGEVAIYFVYDKDSVTYEVNVVDYAKAHNINESTKVSLKQALTNAEVSDTTFAKCYFEIRVKNTNIGLDDKVKQNVCVLIKSLKLTANIDITSGDEVTNNQNQVKKYNFEAPSFTEGNACLIRKATEKGCWTDYQPSVKKAYLCKINVCSFTYDTYEAVFGRMKMEKFAAKDINNYISNKWLKFVAKPLTDSEGDFVRDPVTGRIKVDPRTYVCEILDTTNCPLSDPIAIEDVYLTQDFGKLDKVDCYVWKYKYLYHLDKMPIFIMGTDVSGRDMFVYVFKGLGTSLLLGIATTVICFLFGLLWGSICGYFGGSVDLVMERFTDILSGIPWIVVMTLAIINLGQNFTTFALALCLTGWIGTAATTRTQFYRFRGREYVLASRTLGASHARLIYKHILPNAMGTIITSAVLMVPSVIFSEATISYLGLGFKNLESLGVILSDNQSQLTNHPYLLIFPSVVIALLMISFNLAGNGLRDAVNPSLKGEGE